jgi:DNA-binding GntR family transcriptional regulator
VTAKASAGGVEPKEDIGWKRQLRAYLKSVPAYGSTTDVITDVLREAILDGVLAPATWLREDELANELSVSRTPVRDALRRLADERLAVRLANRGTVVTSMSLDDVLALFMVREQLEGLAARIAAARQPPGLLSSLAKVQEMAVRAAGAKDTAALVELNREFHRQLRESSGNPYLVRFLTQVEHGVRRFQQTTYQSVGRIQETLAEHLAILDAIADGDSDSAVEKATEHMRRAREAQVRAILGS